MVTKEECLTGKVIGAAVEDEGIIVEEMPEGKVKEIYYGNPSAYVRIHNVDGTVDYEAALYETMFDYACEASIEHYAAEGESGDPEYLVEEFKLSEDPDVSNYSDEKFQCNGKTYASINWNEKVICYLNEDHLDDSLYGIIQKDEYWGDGRFKYVYTNEIFATEEEAQARADELNKN